MDQTRNSEQVDQINLTKALIDLDLDTFSPCLIWNDTTFNRAQVIEAIRKISRFYTNLYFPDKGLVILYLPDSPALFVNFLGTILSGLIPVPLSTNMTSHELRTILNDAKPAALITNSDLMKNVLGKTNTTEGCTLLSTEHGLDNLPNIELLAHKSVSKKIHNDCAFLQYTSGSTGKPKAVMHSHVSAFAVYQSYALDTLGMTKEDKVFSAAKMSFGYGLGNSLLFPFQVGATSILVEEKCNFKIIQSVLRAHHPTIFFGVPSLYARILEFISDGNQLDMSNLRLCVSAGEVLPPSIQEKWHDVFGVPIIDGLGSTELLHIVISNTPNNITSGSIGQPIPGCKARVVDSSGKETAPNKQGILEVSAPYGMLGYWSSQSTLNALGHEWISTGDICRKDDNGRFWFCGRSNEIFKVKGLWVSPIEIENTLMKNDLVADVVVSGQQNENRLTEIIATIVPSMWHRKNDIEKSLIIFLKEYLSPHKLPKKFKFVQNLPTTPNGKKNRAFLADTAKIQT